MFYFKCVSIHSKSVAEKDMFDLFSFSTPPHCQNALLRSKSVFYNFSAFHHDFYVKIVIEYFTFYHDYVLSVTISLRSFSISRNSITIFSYLKSFLKESFRKVLKAQNIVIEFFEIVTESTKS